MDLNRMIADIINNAVEDVIRQKEKPLIRGYGELADFLGISKSSAFEMTKHRDFPKHRIGNTTYYLRDEVLNFIRKR